MSGIWSVSMCHLGNSLGKVWQIIVTILVIIDGVWLVLGFIELLQLVTTSKGYALTVLHTSQITIGHIRSSQSVTDFYCRCLVAASNGGRSLSSGHPNCPRPQLQASHSNISQQLDPSGYLANSLTNQPFYPSPNLSAYNISTRTA
jgi:hypothetical protein